MANLNDYQYAARMFGDMQGGGYTQVREVLRKRDRKATGIIHTATAKSRKVTPSITITCGERAFTNINDALDYWEGLHHETGDRSGTTGNGQDNETPGDSGSGAL